MKESTKTTSLTESESLCGRMANLTMENGWMGILMERVLRKFLMGQFMMASGRTECQMEKAGVDIQTDRNTKGCGERDSLMEKELKGFLTSQCPKVSGRMVSVTDQEQKHLKMGQSTKATG